MRSKRLPSIASAPPVRGGGSGPTRARRSVSRVGRSKYGAKAIAIDGIRFASQKEGRRYQELKLLERAGQIRNLELQPRFELSVANGGWPIDNVEHGRSIRLGEYRADFRYEEKLPVPDEWDREWRDVVEDVKGFDVPLGKWKRKHCEAQYGITVVLIR